jgi:amino acid transporter
MEQRENSARLSLVDAVSLVVGIVVGTAIFRSTAEVFANSGSAAISLWAWFLGGALSLVGALCYAELATTYPRTGGDYVYLTRAFGSWAGFLFGWAQLTAVLTSSIGTMAYTLADYGVRLGWVEHGAEAWLAGGAVILLSSANAWGASSGTRTQNLLTAAKVMGLSCVLAAGVLCAARGVEFKAVELLGSAEKGEHVEAAAPIGSFGLAMVFVLFAYGGWNDAAFVAAEVEDRRRNVPRALLGGVAAITLVYLAMNSAYLAALGFDAASRTATPAADVLEAAIGPGGARFVSVLVIISALGAINGMILTGSRLYAALGADHRSLAWLGKPSTSGIPRAALAAQAVVVLGMILAVGTDRGQATVDWLITAAGAPTIPWEQYFGGFETLLAATAPLFWGLFFATGTAMIVLRLREPERERPFSVPWFPLPPVVFCGTCGFMLYHSLRYAGWLTLLALAPAGLGVLVYWISSWRAQEGVGS